MDHNFPDLELKETQIAQQTRSVGTSASCCYVPALAGAVAGGAMTTGLSWW
jgi:hypothetical protein